MTDCAGRGYSAGADESKESRPWLLVTRSAAGGGLLPSFTAEETLDRLNRPLLDPEDEVGLE